MRLVSTRIKKNHFYEKLMISYKHENGKVVSAFSYVDTESSYEYSSELYIQDNEWAAVKIASIHAEKYFADNKIKKPNDFIRPIWHDFFVSKQQVLEGI